MEKEFIHKIIYKLLKGSECVTRELPKDGITDVFIFRDNTCFILFRHYMNDVVLSKSFSELLFDVIGLPNEKYVHKMIISEIKELIEKNYIPLGRSFEDLLIYNDLSVYTKESVRSETKFFSDFNTFKIE